jgi:hypothetical protein
MVGVIQRIGFAVPADFVDVRPNLAAAVDGHEDWLLAEDVDHWAKTQIS